MKKLRKLTRIWPCLVKISHNLPQKFSILVHPEQSEVIIHGANCLFGPASITRYQNIQNLAFQWQRWPRKSNFTLIRPQKADFVQILLLFRARYCLYDQAGSFPSTFIESRPSQGTLGKYFFNRNHWEPKERQIE